MINATIKKLDGTYLDHGKFEDEAAANAWFQPFIDKGVYGQKHVPSRDVPAFLDIGGNEIVPAYTTEEIPAAFVIEYVEIVASPEDELQAKIAAGAAAREACQKVLDFIAGENLSRELTIQEISVLQSTFANAEAALRAGRPTFAKQFISAITPDGELVSQATKDQALALLADY